MYVLFNFSFPYSIIATSNNYDELKAFLQPNLCIMQIQDHSRLFPAPLPPTE